MKYEHDGETIAFLVSGIPFEAKRLEMLRDYLDFSIHETERKLEAEKFLRTDTAIVIRDAYAVREVREAAYETGRDSEITGVRFFVDTGNFTLEFELVPGSPSRYEELLLSGVRMRRQALARRAA